MHLHGKIALKDLLDWRLQWRKDSEEDVSSRSPNNGDVFLQDGRLSCCPFREGCLPDTKGVRKALTFPLPNISPQTRTRARDNVSAYNMSGVTKAEVFASTNQVRRRQLVSRRVVRRESGSRGCLLGEKAAAFGAWRAPHTPPRIYTYIRGGVTATPRRPTGVY